MSERLLLDFDAFFLEHRLCGDLDGDTTDERVWLACIACGARIEQRLTGYDATGVVAYPTSTSMVAASAKDRALLNQDRGYHCESQFRENRLRSRITILCGRTSTTPFDELR